MTQAQATTVTTPVGRLSYPTLFKPKPNQLKQGNPQEYSCQILFKKGEDLSKLQGAIAAVLTKRFGDKAKWPKNLKFPFKKQDDLIETLKAKGKDTSHLEAGAFYLQASMAADKGKPGVYKKGPTGEVVEIVDPTEVYGGCYGCLNLNAFSYDKGANKGASFGLAMVLFVRDGDPFGTRTSADEAFSAVTFDTGMDPADALDMMS